MFKLVFKKSEEPEIKLPTSAGSWKKQESYRKTSISALLTMPKPLTVWITINCGKLPTRLLHLWNFPGKGTGVGCHFLLKLLHNCTHLTPCTVVLQILPARLQRMRTENVQMFKLDLEKTEEPEVKLPTSVGSSKKQENFRKTSTYWLR